MGAIVQMVIRTITLRAISVNVAAALARENNKFRSPRRGFHRFTDYQLSTAKVA